MTGKITEQELSPGLVQKISSDKYGIATQAEALAGTSDTKYMTPLRVKQATPKNVANGFAGLDGAGKISMDILPALEALVKVQEVDIAALGGSVGFNFLNASLYKRLVVRARDLLTASNFNPFGAALTFNDISSSNAYNARSIGSTSAATGGDRISFTTGSGNHPLMDIDLIIEPHHPQYRTEAIVLTGFKTGSLQSATHLFGAMPAQQSSPINKVTLVPRAYDGSIAAWASGTIEVWGVLR